MLANFNIINLPPLYKEIWEKRPIPSALLSYQQDYKPIYIYGKSGAGKTCLAISLLTTVPPKLTVLGTPAAQKFLYVSYPQLSYDEYATRNAVIRNIKQQDGVLLDDFVPDGTNALFFIIVDICYTSKIPLFVTSNYDAKVFVSQPHIARRLTPFNINKLKENNNG